MRRLSTCSAVIVALCWSVGASATPNQGPRILIDVPDSSVVDPAASVLSARDLLARSAHLSPTVQLAPQRLFTIGGSKVYRFGQTYQGLDVIGRGGALVTYASGKPRFATIRVEDRLPASVVPTLTPDRAAAIAAQRAGIPASASNARLVVWPTPAGAILAWSVLPPSLLPLPYVPLVVVDATTGDVLSFQNLVRHKNLARSFEFNPVSTPDLIDVTLPIDDPLTVPQNALTESYNCVDTHQVKTVTVFGVNFTVHVCEMLQNAEADAVTGDYTQYGYVDDTSGGDPFAEISIFYHANKAYSFFKGFDPNFELEADSKPLFLVANLMTPAGLMAGDFSKMADPDIPFDPFPNAFSTGWDPQYGPIVSTLWPQITGGALMFGQGAKADFAYDGDVVYHEFTHSVVGATIKLVGSWHLDSQGATVAPGAMNEALADYFSSAIAGDAASGEYAGTEFGDDAIRHIDNDFVCPKNLAGEVHYDSQFFSAALWAVRSELGSDADRRLFDEAIFTALTAGPSGDLSYEQVAQLFVTSVESSALGSAVGSQLQSAFESRGVLPACNRTVEWTGTPISSPDPNLARHFIAGGTANFTKSMTYAPGLFQVHVPLPANTTQLKMSFVQMVSGGTSPLPTGNTPYKPAFLVSFDTPIEFNVMAGGTANTDTLVDAAKSGTSFSAQVDVPASATDAYVMVVNKGQDDGYYEKLSFDTVVDEPPPDAGADAQDSGVEPDGAVDDASGQDAAVNPPSQNAADSSDDSGGCGCSVPSSARTSATALGLLGLFLGSVVARRRKTARIRP